LTVTPVRPSVGRIPVLLAELSNWHLPFGA